jgi:hypothetical protein
MAQQTLPAEFVLCKQCGRVIDPNAEADSLFARVPITEVISPGPQHFTDEGTYKRLEIARTELPNCLA